MFCNTTTIVYILCIHLWRKDGWKGLFPNSPEVMFEVPVYHDRDMMNIDSKNGMLRRVEFLRYNYSNIGGQHVRLCSLQVLEASALSCTQPLRSLRISWFLSAVWVCAIVECCMQISVNILIVRTEGQGRGFRRLIFATTKSRMSRRRPVRYIPVPSLSG